MPGDRPGATEVRSVYVHAPFCARRCVYCDFAVHVAARGDLRAWLVALAGELEAVRREGTFVPAEVLDTLYVGGGTPSLLGPDAMDGLADVLGRGRVGPSTEWTAEANPESFTPELAEAWRRAGVGRVSLGIQSFQEAPLRWMGRLHGPDGARRAVERARSAGFDTLSVDLIFGLPERLARNWSEDLERALELDVPHVSLYGLTVEPATRLGRAVAAGSEAPVDEERYRAEFMEAAATLTAAGFEHYEVSNFARPGHASRHNRVYWDGRPYLGLGNGAHSYAHPLRRWNVRDWGAYRDRAASGSLPEAERELLDEDAHRLEAIWLGLRTSDGLPMGSLGDRQRALATSWAQRGLAEVDAARVVLTTEGWLLLDRLAVDLDAQSP